MHVLKDCQHFVVRIQKRQSIIKVALCLKCPESMVGCINVPQKWSQKGESTEVELQMVIYCLIKIRLNKGLTSPKKDFFNKNCCTIFGQKPHGPLIFQ